MHSHINFLFVNDQFRHPASRPRSTISKVVKNAYLPDYWPCTQQRNNSLQTAIISIFTNVFLKVDANEAFFLYYMTPYHGLMVSHT